ncbi:MAG: FtsW/RodA/SpoVE family cell cycle protein, partial [Firmicutes bacterium]|nr:FtsW/RodA/SpoVE family cell cycle protein [Bacillota bacterium]
MAQLAIILSKYLFIVYIIVFLWHGFIAATNKNDLKKYNNSLSKQRAMLCLFHINAVIILALAQIDNIYFILTRGIVILMFLIFAPLLIKKLYPNCSHILWNGVLFLGDVGIITLYTLNPSLAQKQFVWHAVGFAAALVLPAILDRLPRLDKFAKFYIITAIVLLVATLIFGNDEFGSRNWITIGAITFQPSEVVKLLFILYLASTLSQNPSPRQLIAPSVLCVVILLCFVAQKDLGSALIFFMSFMVVVYIATSKIAYFAAGTLAAGLGAYLAYLIFPHIKVRVSAWLDPWSDIAGKGYQIAHSLFAIATYGLTGAGLTRGYSTSIPVVDRDFIFSAICEEFGVVFGIGVVLVFLMIFLEGAVGALNAHNRFLCMFCAGLTSLIAFQTFVILGGVTKLIPLTGVTLPFVSYGGTSLMMCYVLAAIIQWIYQSCVQYV